jgi:hypothetical protein
MRSSSGLAVWALSAAIGVLGIFIFFALGVPGLVLLFAPLVVSWSRSGPRGSLRAGGALAGFGATYIALMAAANARCAEFSAPDRQDCMAPDVTVFTVAAAVLVVVGLALTLRGSRLRST